MGEQKKSKKVIRAGGGLPFGGDPMVDRNGISTESHMDIYRRLVKAGIEGMHGHPGPRKPKRG